MRINFKNGGQETYRDQLHSVNFVASLTVDHIVTTIAICDEEHDLQLTPQLRSIGVSYQTFSKNLISSFFDDICPDILICRTPHREVLRQAKSRGIKTLPCFADTFTSRGWKRYLKNIRLRIILSGSNFPCIANHSLNASRSVCESLFYPREKVVPWDWQQIQTPYFAKNAMKNPQKPTMFFAGAITIDKGISDCLDAIKKLHDLGIEASMTFAGSGDIEQWLTYAKKLNIADFVDFIGLIPNNQVCEKMQLHDIVIVPSRHRYPEGLPNTIYEGLASCSALIISDHPSFQNRLREKLDCLIFKASEPQSLADNILLLCQDQSLYQKLSQNSQQALTNLFVGLEWSELVTKFINDPNDSSGWVKENSLKTLNL